MIIKLFIYQIEDNLNSFGLRAKDIRVVKKKDPGWCFIYWFYMQGKCMGVTKIIKNAAPKMF